MDNVNRRPQRNTQKNTFNGSLLTVNDLREVNVVGDFSSLAKMIIGVGLFLLIVGGLMLLLGKFGLGKLPGDILIKKDNFTLYFPLVSGLLISLVLTVIANLFFRH